MKRFCCIFLCLAFLLAGVACGRGGTSAISKTDQKSIYQIERMKSIPENYKYKDYADVAKRFDETVYAFAKYPENPGYDGESYTPIGYWDDTHVNIDFRTFGFPSYVASNSAGEPGMQEGITVMGSVWGATVAGIDKSAQTFVGENGTEYTYNFVKMLETFFNTDEDVRFVMNNKKQKTGNTFWYEIYPQIQFIRIADLYPQEQEWMVPIILEGAERWHEALPNFQTDGETDFAFVSYDFAVDMPIYGAQWNEPPNGGLAMIFYSAYKLTGEEKYLEDCKTVLDYLQDWGENPYYEILSDYAPYIAAVLNAEHGTNYDIQKFINYAFAGGADYREGSQVVVGKWGDYTADGLMGFGYDDTSGEGYAFAMNTFHMASTLAPTVKYDPRFANAIGKWFLNVVNSARIFYGDELPAENQTCPDASAFDPTRSIAYEGVRSTYNYKNQGTQHPMAMGDPTIHGWGLTDVGIYGGGHVGLLGGIVEQTNVDKILQIDLNKTDSFDDNYPCFLYYNPYTAARTITVDYGEAYKLYDTVSNTVIAESASKADITIPAETSVVVALLPANAETSEANGIISCNGVFVSNDFPVVNILSPADGRKTVSSGDIMELEYFPKGAQITQIIVRIGDLVLYKGEPEYSIELWIPLNVRGKQCIRVDMYTDNGLMDTASIHARIF